MKKGLVRALLLVTVLCCFGFGAYVFYGQRTADTVPPEILFASDDVLRVSVLASDAERLAGVTAWDDRDGDVSAGLVIEGIGGLSSDQMASITYAAFDRAGNVAKAQRVLQFTDYHSPRFSLSGPLVFSSSASVNLLDYLGAEDVIDGSLNDRIKATLVKTDTELSEEGVHEVEFRVTNSMKDTAYLTVPVDIYPAGMYNASVLLTSYLVYLERGSSFDPLDYLDRFQRGTETTSLKDSASGVSVSCDSDVKPGIPGTYSVKYTVKSGVYTGYTRLIVVVVD